MEIDNKLHLYISSLEEISVNLARVSTPDEWRASNNKEDYFEFTLRLPNSIKPYMDHVETVLKDHVVDKDAVEYIENSMVMHDIFISLIFDGILRVVRERKEKLQKEVDAIKESNPNAIN